ncbi:ribonuclease R [Sphingobium wenxiniae]|uniref:Ribonuclease R n=1 Tax=Sphingobium wenxiniae (strain DSM 21828 / CGMCC 1.7748 / JZ-1) TaxID=595605 RepID=A0A562KKE1_SPHWJ|nr:MULTISPECIES: ribonuclease R [Sphingobium]MBB6192223.1 ribonuclease R [Sphingobium wenxiniae]TWH95837.1 ribonuclease R [Sphingobium wenxiniae]WRD77606.1 ribonuclease R [Sphingobium baderi]
MASTQKQKKSAPPRDKVRPAGFPTRDQVMEFITSSDQPAGKREIAKAFGLKGQEKIALKALLKDMADEGLIDIGPARAFHKMGGVPKVTVLRIVDVDDTTLIATPERWEAEGQPAPRLRVVERGKRGALTIGDRILARTEEAGRGWVAHPMKKLAKASEELLGVVEEGPKEQNGVGKLWLRPVDKRIRRDTPISDAGTAKPGDLVLAEPVGRPPRITARVTDILGDPFAPRSFSLIAIHKHGIPHVFPEQAEEEAVTASKLPLHEDKREDLRHLPIVAIDPADARDHDDAVWAAPDDDPANPGGYRAIVAIADVSYYVRPGSALDREARKRGNSVYFPDLVVPMLPHQLSSDMCSLRAGEDRAAMACHLVVDAKGKVTSWRFSRAVIRVAAVLAYEDAQAAIDGTKEHDLLEPALRPLWACWALLRKAREKRDPLALDLPERRVVLDEWGKITSVAVRERLDAHMLIEDYMIAANVAAAKALEAKKAPVMYRDHEPPSRDKLVALKDYLATFDIDFALGQVIKPSTFNRLIERVGEAEEKPQIMEQILRSQTQAYYSPQNMGHFGLALGSYAHFTSPIRRYADLLVHRALVGAHGLELPAPKGGALPDRTALSGEDYENMGRVGEMISQHERRAMEAERETVDRYVAAFLAAHVGELVEARITGVQNFGFFATVEGLGGDGLVPVSTLGDERFYYDEAARALEGVESGERYTVGQRLQLRLAEADPINGALRFALPDAPPQRPSFRKDRARPGGIKRGRPANIRHIGSARGRHKKR